MTTALIRTALLTICLLGIVDNCWADDKPPRAIDDRLKIELFAEHPDIVTPTGIDVDHQGRVWAIESNTHFPPAGYQGHPSDRILVMQDSTGDHKADKITVFADGLKHTMSIAVKPVWLQGRVSRVKGREQGGTKSRGSRVEGREQENKASGGRKPADEGGRESRVEGPEPTQTPGKLSTKKALDSRPSTLDIFIATRRAIWLYTDTNGDLKADKKERIIQLDTKGDYPHNGLAGFAFDAMGWMYFGFGENLGADYKIIGSDGVTLKGGGEGGNVYRCRPDGSKLTQWATGFWNPHASCVDAFGRLFTVDNDPDSRPPCRLLHVIEGGDYGFRFRNGRKGLHPFTAWNGEIPGTLPMVSGTGEAPSGIVAYESDGFPKDYIGNLLVGSWGDHRIDRFRLKPRGASFESLPETIIQGGEDFRPVGLAVAPDGSLFLTDWVKRDYKLHGHGRVWRVSLKDEVQRDVVNAAAITAETSVEKLAKLLESPRLEVRRTVATQLQSTPAGRKHLAESLGSDSDRKEIEALWGLVRIPIEVENTGLYAIFGGTLPGQIRSKRARSAHFELLASDPPQLPYSSELGQMLAMLSGYSIADKQLLKSFKDGNMHGDDLTTVISAVRVAAPWLSPRMLFELEYEGEETDKSEHVAISRLVEQTDPFLFEAFVDAMSRSPDVIPENTARHVAQLKFPRSRLAYLLSARRRNPREQSPLRWSLKDPDPRVRRTAVQWIAEENLTGFRPQVEAILNSTTMTTDLFLATLAALEMLDGKDPKDFDKTPAGKYVLPLVKDDKRSPAVRAQALRLVDENDPALTKKLMAGLMSSEDYSLRLETVRTLQSAKAPYAKELLIKMARSERPWRQPRNAADYKKVERTFFDHRRLMLEAILGLASRANQSPPDKEAIEALTSLLDESLEIRIEVIRSLRTVARTNKKVRAAILESISFRTGNPDWWDDVDEHLHMIVPADSEYAASYDRAWKKRPDTTENWIALAQKKGVSYDKTKQTMGIEAAASGRRVFFHSNGAGCYKCHTVNGRGGKVGPDLSHIGGSPAYSNKEGRKRLAESILEPSKEIAPQFTNWTFIMESGKVHSGIILGDTRDKKQTIGLADGTTLELPTAEIEERQPQQKSIMPEKLIERLTVGEFRDLLAFLESLK